MLLGSNTKQGQGGGGNNPKNTVRYLLTKSQPPSILYELHRKLQPIPRKVPRKEPLRILRRLLPRALPRRIRRQRRLIPAALPVRVHLLLQRQQGLRRADAKARMAARVGAHRVVGVFLQRDMDLLAGGADVEPGQLVGLRGGDGARGQAEGRGVEGFGFVEGVVGDCYVDVVEACDERPLGAAVSGGHGGGDGELCMVQFCGEMVWFRE